MATTPNRKQRVIETFVMGMLDNQKILMIPSLRHSLSENVCRLLALMIWRISSFVLTKMVMLATLLGMKVEMLLWMIITFPQSKTISNMPFVTNRIIPVQNLLTCRITISLEITEFFYLTTKYNCYSDQCQKLLRHQCSITPTHNQSDAVGNLLSSSKTLSRLIPKLSQSLM